MRHIPRERLEMLKTSLERMEAELVREVKELELPPDMGSDVDEFEEEAEEAQAFGVNLGIEELVRRRLDHVREALEKMRRGTYGICERCKGEISLEVLVPDPESELCSGCKSPSSMKNG